ncbi:CPBP family intramembrane glutamic endopeptidase [Synechococcus sp. 1G10]|uniref:CPBP family intramembrane glutamic endopeptidase n=1 Tax=Synechococcus sp. 1G10 TaxID=2025605 RepID=UPI000B987DA2|nr:type II CAAX endopeptidase family protein [Synechococcus sp. 1G10]
MKNTKTLWIALAVFVGWLMVTIGGGAIRGGGSSSLNDMVSRGLAWQFVAAIGFLCLVTAIFGLREIGFRAPEWGFALRILWLPGLMIVLFFSLALVLGLPGPVTTFWVALNTLLVGISEEWMFRGIIFKGLTDRFSVWKAVWLSSLLFGGVHALNVFVTGELQAGLIQAAAASFSGILFAAIRVRTQSLYPVILTHALWDFAVFMVISSGHKAAGTGAQSSVGLSILAPFLLAAPGFFYGLYLLRRVKPLDNGQPV